MNNTCSTTLYNSGTKIAYKTRKNTLACHDLTSIKILRYSRDPGFFFNETPKQKGYIMDTRDPRHVQNENREGAGWGRGRGRRYGNVGQIYHPEPDRPILLSLAAPQHRSKLA